jgi:hypothetical protein
VPYLAAELRLNGELAMAAQAPATQPERLVERHDNYNLTIHSNARAEDVEQDYHRWLAQRRTDAWEACTHRAVILGPLAVLAALRYSGDHGECLSLIIRKRPPTW